MYENFSDHIIDRINKNFSRVNSFLNIYLKNPDEKNIHEIRKSIRRAESAYITLPKKYRKKKKIRDFIDKSKAFFKINSQIRNYDIYLQKIEKFKKTDHMDSATETNATFSSVSSNDNNYNNNDIISEIQNYRKSKLRNAKIAAEKLKDLDYPQIKKNNKKIQEKINSRFRKVTKKFNEKIKKNLPIVINDKNKVEELHTLRKDSKRLRYVLELKSIKMKKDNNNDNDELNNSITKLEELQDSLGEIHDCDAMLSFFEKLEKFPETKTLVDKESEIRKYLYETLVHKYKEFDARFSFS